MLINNFTEFVAYSMLEGVSLETWIEHQKQLQAGGSNLLDTTTYNQHAQHANDNPHTDRAHSDSSTHSDSAHSDSSTHSDHNNKLEGVESHTQTNSHNDRGHSDVDQHTDNGRPGSAHKDVNGGHKNSAAHSQSSHQNFTSHADKHIDHSQVNHSNRNHSNGYDHSNRNHSDYNTHSDRTPHTDVGFNHSNYIPANPALMNIENGGDARDVMNVGIYSYDKNIDGFGTQDAQSKDVYYNVRIRRIKDLDGNADVSGWVTYMSGSKSNEFSFNTIDPLKNGNKDYKKTEGFYEIECSSYNTPLTIKGVTKTYNSQTTRATFRIIQNFIPEVTVNNPGEYVRHNVGLDGTAINDKFTEYDNKYAGVNLADKHGIFVDFTITDGDPEDGHHAWVFLRDSSGNQVSNKVKAVLTGDNNGKDGFAFIPKSDFLNKGYIADAQVVVEVIDYQLGDFSKPAGAHLYQNRVTSNGVYMFLNIDPIAPDSEYREPDSYWVQNESIEVKFTDVGTGVKEAYYQVVPRGAMYSPTDWTKSSNNASTQVPIVDEGIWEVWTRIVDNGGNETINLSEPYKIAPITMDIATLPQYPNSIPITENLFVEMNTDCLVDIVGIDTWVVDDRDRTDSTLSTLDVNRSKYWDGYIPIPRVKQDGDYTVIAEVFREDGSSETITTPLKVFTPINLGMKTLPVFELGQPVDLTAVTTKYVEDTKVKLFVGTAFETDWLVAYDTMVEGKKEWTVDYVVPEDIPVGNYEVEITATLPTGKAETIKSKFVYLSVKSNLKHTDEWEANRISFNQYKSGIAEYPRTHDIFFNGEKFVVDVDVETGDPSIYAGNIRVSLVGDSFESRLNMVGGDVGTWTGNLFEADYKKRWEGGKVVPVTIEVMVDMNYGVTKTYKLYGVVDSTAEYWRQHLSN